MSKPNAAVKGKKKKAQRAFQISSPSSARGCTEASNIDPLVLVWLQGPTQGRWSSFGWSSLVQRDRSVFWFFVRGAGFLSIPFQLSLRLGRLVLKGGCWVSYQKIVPVGDTCYSQMRVFCWAHGSWKWTIEDGIPRWHVIVVSGKNFKGIWSVERTGERMC